MTDELLVSIATTVGGEINRALGFLQNVGLRGDIKQLAVVCGSLLIAAIIEPGVTSGLDVRGGRTALFDDIEEGGIRASSSYSSHEINEHENERAMDGLQDRVLMLKRPGEAWY